jgi:Family of unknown function (DUF5985)
MPIPLLKGVLMGAIMVSSWSIALFFFRFWAKTRDRLFLLFGVAFILLGLERLYLVVMASDTGGYLYLVRLLAFILILVAIAEKNRNGKATG